MIFAKALEFIYVNVFINILIFIFLILAGVTLYKNSVKSRKYYICTHCGESFRSEHMNSKCCKVCGAPVKEKDDKNVNDSTL